MQCQAKTKSDERCKLTAREGSQFCAVHDAGDSVSDAKASAPMHAYQAEYAEWKANGRKGPRPTRPSWD